MAKRFDIDAVAGGYEPVVIVLRGREYALGTTAMQLLRIGDIRATVKQEAGEDKVALAARLVEPTLRELAPEVAPVLDAQPLSVAEQLALMPAITEVMASLGRFRAPADQP